MWIHDNHGHLCYFSRVTGLLATHWPHDLVPPLYTCVWKCFLRRTITLLASLRPHVFLCHNHQTQIFGGLAHFCQAKHVAQNHQLLASHWPQDVLTLTKHSQVCNLATLWPQDVLYTCVWKCFLRTIRLLASPWPHFLCHHNQTHILGPCPFLSSQTCSSNVKHSWPHMGHRIFSHLLNTHKFLIWPPFGHKKFCTHVSGSVS